MLASTIHISIQTYAQAQTNQTTGLAIFEDPKYGFRMEYPSEWELWRQGMTGLSIAGLPSNILAINSPGDFATSETVQISVQNQTKHLDTDEMVVKTANLTAQDFADEAIAAGMEGGSPYFKLVRQNSTTVSDIPAWRIEYILGRYTVETFVVKDDKVFKITFSTPTLEAPESLPLFNKLLDSIRIT